MFQLATASHHLIYSGSLMLAETRQLTPIFAVLMSDLLLLTRPDPESSSLVVLAEPLSLQHIVGSSFHCSHRKSVAMAIENTPKHCDVRVLKRGTHWRQRWSTLLKVDCCRNRQQIGNKVDCCRIRSTLLPVCTGAKA